MFMLPEGNMCQKTNPATLSSAGLYWKPGENSV
jgi:hypothetical protein